MIEFALAVFFLIITMGVNRIFKMVTSIQFAGIF